MVYELYINRAVSKREGGRKGGSVGGRLTYQPISMYGPSLDPDLNNV